MRVLLVLLFLVLLVGPSNTPAEASLNRPPQSFNAFWRKFKTAVARNNKVAVASMTRLPFLFAGQELDRAGFLKRYDEIINLRDRQCIAQAKPLKDGDSYSVFCGPLIFVFSQSDGVWKFSGFSPND
jgi:hypothetical protein